MYLRTARSEETLAAKDGLEIWHDRALAAMNSARTARMAHYQIYFPILQRLVSGALRREMFPCAEMLRPERFGYKALN